MWPSIQATHEERPLHCHATLSMPTNISHNTRPTTPDLKCGYTWQSTYESQPWHVSFYMVTQHQGVSYPSVLVAHPLRRPVKRGVCVKCKPVWTTADGAVSHRQDIHKRDKRKEICVLDSVSKDYNQSLIPFNPKFSIWGVCPEEMVRYYIYRLSLSFSLLKLYHTVIKRIISQNSITDRFIIILLQKLTARWISRKVCWSTHFFTQKLAIISENKGQRLALDLRWIWK